MGGRETILLVEDEEGVRRVTKRVLESYGYKVLEAMGPGEAVALTEKYQGSIELLLTDVVMPIMSGVELKQRIRALRPGIKVLFVSGYPEGVEISSQALAEEDTDFLQKPFESKELARKVRQLLDR